MSILNFCFRTFSVYPKPRFGILPKLNSQNPSRTIYYDTGFSGKAQSLKVCVLGAAGRVGQPLCLLLKHSSLIDEIATYDVTDPCTFATELAHIDTRCRVSAYSGLDHIGQALRGSKIVVILAAAKKSSILPFDSMFTANALIMQELILKIVQHSPKAFIAIATHPVNSLVPLASELLKDNGVYNSKTVFGITTLDLVRANTFVAEVQGLEPECVFVPVIGGHCDETIVPVLSLAKPCSDFTNEEIEKITKKIQNAHQDMLKAKFKQATSLSCSFAIARFIVSLIKGIRQYCNIKEYAYVKSDAHREATYFASPIRLGLGGIQTNFGIPELSDYETCILENAVPLIARDIKQGVQFARGSSKIKVPTEVKPTSNQEPRYTPKTHKEVCSNC